MKKPSAWELGLGINLASSTQERVRIRIDLFSLVKILQVSQRMFTSMFVR
jgi:hypothetical protein